MLKKFIKLILYIPFKLLMKVLQPIYNRLNEQNNQKLDSINHHMTLILKAVENHQKDMKELTFETDRMILNFLKSPIKQSHHIDEQKGGSQKSI